LPPAVGPDRCILAPSTGYRYLHNKLITGISSYSYRTDGPVCFMSSSNPTLVQPHETVLGALPLFSKRLSLDAGGSLGLSWQLTPAPTVSQSRRGHHSWQLDHAIVTRCTPLISGARRKQLPLGPSISPFIQGSWSSLSAVMGMRSALAKLIFLDFNSTGWRSV